MQALDARINGIDTEALKGVMQSVREDKSRGIAGFRVTTAWKGGTKSESRVAGWSLGGEDLARDFTIAIDEPEQLLGTNTAANPQEYLMAAVNACMMATYVAACAMQGITLESLEFELSGELDLRGFLGLNSKVKPGYDEVQYTIRVKGDGTPEQFQKVSDWVKKTSPNYFNLAEAIQLKATQVIA